MQKTKKCKIQNEGTNQGINPLLNNIYKFYEHYYVARLQVRPNQTTRYDMLSRVICTHPVLPIYQ
jgi:hypothetical protein